MEQASMKQQTITIGRMVILFSVFTVLLLLSGCTHAMRITNADKFTPSPTAPLTKPVKLGVTSASDAHPQNKRYVAAIIEALQKNGSVSQVLYPYKRTENDPVDAVADITVNPKYSGVGSNFFVNFPGFLIFAPAIWGYGYQADIDTQVFLVNSKDSSQQQISIPCSYEFRQADMNRTWTEMGWFEVGIIPLVGGIVFTGYDEKVTEQFITKVSPSYGPFVAIKIVSAIKPAETATSIKPAETAATVLSGITGTTESQAK
jgi:hypothetical protein